MVLKAKHHLRGLAARKVRLGVFAATLGAFASSASAEERLELDYEVYFGGMHILSAQTKLQADGQETYSVSSSARTRGWVNWLFGFSGEGTTVGTVNGTEVRPQRHARSSAWDDGERKVTLTYLDNGKVLAEVNETREDYDEDKFSPLDPATFDNTIDPMTAFIAMSRRLDAGESCDASFEMFDGRRRYDVTLTDHGTKQIEPNDYSVFTGEAVGCHLEFEKIGGFWQGKNKYSETARNRVIWVARPIEDGPPVPVQLTIETGFGSLMAHLTRVRVGGQELALNVD